MTKERLAEIRMRYEQRKSFIRSSINMSLPGAAALVEKDANPDVRDLLAEVDRLRNLIDRHNATMVVVRNGIHQIDYTSDAGAKRGYGRAP